MKPTVFLDLDDTIFDFKTAENISVKRTLTALGIPATDGTAGRYSEINDAQWKLLEQGKITRNEVLTRRFQLLFQEIGVKGDPEKTWHLYETFLSKSDNLMPGAMELLKTLSGKYILCAASNGTVSVQYSRLRCAGIEPFFQKIFISQEVGAEKPSPAFFDACFSRLPESDRSRSIMIGDRLSSDISGGKAAGLMTCWYNGRQCPPTAAIVPDHTVTSLGEIPPLLEKLFGI